MIVLNRRPIPGWARGCSVRSRTVGHTQMRLPGTMWRGLVRAAPPAPSSAGAALPRVIIGELRAEGMSWHGVARTLNARGVPTPSGRGRWYPETANRHANPDAWAAAMRAYRAGVRRRPPRA